MTLFERIVGACIYVTYSDSSTGFAAIQVDRFGCAHVHTRYGTPYYLFSEDLW